MLGFLSTTGALVAVVVGPWVLALVVTEGFAVVVVVVSGLVCEIAHPLGSKLMSSTAMRDAFVPNRPRNTN